MSINAREAQSSIPFFPPQAILIESEVAIIAMTPLSSRS
jgi:hypothetical protein